MSDERNGKPRLIVNADDFGLSSAVNHAVERAHREGILTSATLLANGPAFDEAVRIAKMNPRLGVGAHLNLARGRPVGNGDGLAGVDGSFDPKRARRVDMRAALMEYGAQLLKIWAAGIRPTHVDFEKHQAWRPHLHEAAMMAADTAKVYAMRNLRPSVWHELRWWGWPGARRMGWLCGLACAAPRKASGVWRPDRLAGVSRIGRMDEFAWARFFAAPLPGVTEMMTHPGEADDSSSDGMGASWIDPFRPVELGALVSSRVRDAGAASGVRLTTFALR